MKKSATAEKDALFYQHMQEMLRYHQFMLRDEERNKIFYEALERLVTSDTRVLDIGSGSGVWAIAAAKLGAKSVTAIESNTPMIPLIMAHAAENGVSDRIKIVNGLSLDVNLKHKYDLIVSETIGNQAFDENIVPTMVDARQRFLAKGGVLLPQRVALKAAPAHLSDEGRPTPRGVPVSTNYLNGLALNITSKIANKDQLELLDAPAKLLEVDLRSCDAEPNLGGLTAEWAPGDLSKVNVIALWAECELADDIVLDTWHTTNWMPVVCRFKPFDGTSGKLQFTLNIDAQLYHWTVRSDGFAAQAYTPIFAYTKIKLDSRRAPRQVKPRKR